MQEHGIHEGQEFRIKLPEPRNTERIVFIRDNTMRCSIDKHAITTYWWAVLSGEAEIEIPKAKTLRGQIEQQGHYWLLDYDGQISKQHFQEIEEEELTQGNAFLTESDAKREEFRRNLEFRVKEWLRERDCLSGYTGWTIKRYLNILMIDGSDTISIADVHEKFKDDYDKYENWGINENT